MKAGKQKFAHLVALLLLINPFFGQILPSPIGQLSFIFGALLASLWLITSKETLGAYISLGTAAWILLATLAGISNYSSSGRLDETTLVLMASVALMTFASASTAWILPAIRVMFALSIVHAMATVFFYISPSVYSTFVKPVFFAANVGAVDFTSGLTTHYSYNAMFISFGFLIAAVRAICGARSYWLNTFLALTTLLALVLTSKRAHLVFALLSVALLYLLSSSRGKFLKLGSLLAAGTIVVFWLAGFSEGVATSLDRLLGTFDTTDLSEATNGRTFLWQTAFNGWRENPLLGNGWNSFHFDWPGGDSTSTHAHNQILNLLYESGSAGAILFIIAAASSMAIAARAMKTQMSEPTSQEARIGAAFSFAGQLFLLTYALSSGELLTSSYVIVPYFLAVTIGHALGRPACHKVSAPAAKPTSGMLLK